MSGEYQDLLQGAVTEGNEAMQPVAPVKTKKPAKAAEKPVKERRWSLIVNDVELYKAMRNYVDDLKDEGVQTDRTKEILKIVRKELEAKGYLKRRK